MIELSQLEEMFANMRAETDWDLDGPMLWGYFFTDRSEQKLRGLIPVLEAQGYRFVDIFAPDVDEGDEPYFFLHVEKEEVHSPESLHACNQHFYALADLHQLESYDGMDVGPIVES